MKWMFAAALALLVVAPAYAQDTTKPAGPKKAGAPRRPRPAHDDTGRVYMGREIADVMGFQGAEWLIRPEREDEERPEQMLDALKIRPGDTVADVGAGVGYTSARLSRRVGAKGRVLATDVQPEMLSMLRDNMKAAGISNVKAIACSPTDPKLPEGAVDLALLIDVYHECSDPVATLKGLRKSLKPGGRLVLVEFRAEDPDVPIKPEHKMTVAQVRKEIEPQGFAFKELIDTLPWQHILIFEKAADPPAADKAVKEKAGATSR